MSDDHLKTCESCSASVYPEHIDSGIAGYHGGQLLCSHCLAEQQALADASGSAAAQDPELAAIAIDDQPATPEELGSTAIHGFSGGDSLAGAGFAADDETKFKRRLDPRSPFGTRCRTFHSKLSDGAVAYMNEQVNDWADSNKDVNIKFATSTIGIFEGKHADPHLILTVFY
jgi:hypothetical protein